MITISLIFLFGQCERTVCITPAHRWIVSILYGFILFDSFLSLLCALCVPLFFVFLHRQYSVYQNCERTRKKWREQATAKRNYEREKKNKPALATVRKIDYTFVTNAKWQYLRKTSKAKKSKQLFEEEEKTKKRRRKKLDTRFTNELLSFRCLEQRPKTMMGKNIIEEKRWCVSLGRI